MNKDTTTIRITNKTKEELDEIKGINTYEQMIKQLIEFFLTKK